MLEALTTHVAPQTPEACRQHRERPETADMLDAEFLDVVNALRAYEDAGVLGDGICSLMVSQRSSWRA